MEETVLTSVTDGGCKTWHGDSTEINGCQVNRWTPALLGSVKTAATLGGRREMRKPVLKHLTPELDARFKCSPPVSVEYFQVCLRVETVVTQERPAGHGLSTKACACPLAVCSH